MTIENERKVFACQECQREYDICPEACECGGKEFDLGAPSGRKARKERADLKVVKPSEAEEPEEKIGDMPLSDLTDEIQTFLRTQFRSWGRWDPEQDEELVTIFDASDTKDARLAEATASQCGSCNRIGLGLRMSDGMIVCPDCGTEQQGMVRDAGGFEVPGEKKKKAVGARVVRAKAESAAVAQARVHCYLCDAKIEKNHGLCVKCWMERNIRLYGQPTCPAEKLEEHTKEAIAAFTSGEW